MVRLAMLAATLLLLVGCEAGREAEAPGAAATSPSPSSADWAHVESMNVILTSFAFDPSRIALREDRPYRLHVENRATGAHNFAAPDFLKAAVLRDDPVGREAKATGGVELAGGEAKDLYVMPSRAGTFPVECTHLLHALFGMTGEIVVEPAR